MDIGLDSFSSSTAPERVDSVGTNIDTILSTWASSYTDNLAPISPRTLWFQPVEEAVPLFSTVDALDMEI